MNNMYTNYTVQDILHALDTITGGRCVTNLTDLIKSGDSVII